MWEKWKKQAQKNGVTRKIFRERVKLGWDFKRAATTVPRKRVPRSDAEWLELAKRNGIPSITYRARVDRNFWSPEEAATTPVLDTEEVIKRAHEVKAEYTAIQHKRIEEDPNNLFHLTPKHYAIAEENGICRDTVRSRVYIGGWTAKEAISIPIRKQDDDFKQYKVIAKENGISESVFTDRVKKLGWDMEVAATTPTRRRYEDEWTRLAESNGIRSVTYQRRVRDGWDKEEAATTPTLKCGQYSSKGKIKNEKIIKDMMTSFKGR